MKLLLPRAILPSPATVAPPTIAYGGTCALAIGARAAVRSSRAVVMFCFYFFVCLSFVMVRWCDEGENWEWERWWHRGKSWEWERW